ncbi:MAG: extracellular solute-binding protein [Candidatus Dojkabacteria bacterium]|nr:extracellular solute-binding protein [Candidatus Dojkabacteria bacterium]
MYNINMEAKKKKLLLILGGILIILIISLVVLLLDLPNDSPDSTDSSNSDQTTDIELTYWGLWEPASVMQPIIDAYEEENPGVTILYSQQAFTNYEGRLYTRLEQAATSTEPAPDIFRINNTWTSKYYKYLSALPSTVMDSTTYSETFYPTATADFTAKDGNIYAMPWEIDGLAVFYNKQLLSAAGVSEPPTDWDSFIELAEELTTKNDSGQIISSGLAIGTADNITHSADILSYLMLLNGADLIDSTYTTTDLTSTEVLTAVEIYTSFSQGDNALWTTDLADDLEMFYAGKLAMMFAPSWRAFDIIQSAPSIEFGIASLPQLSNNNPVYYSMYWGDSVSSTCENPEVAWDFIKYLVDHQQEIYSNSSSIRAFGEPYSLVSLNESLASQSYIEAYAIMAPYMESWNMGDQSFVEETLRSAITSIIEDGDDIESAMKNAQQDINDQLAETNK